MKIKFYLLSVLVAACLTTNAQQIPNNGFESWTTNPYAPDNWSTFESGFNLPFGLSKRDTVDKFAGAASISLFSDSVPGQPQLGVLSGIVSLGTINVSTGNPTFYGIPFTYRPDTIHFIVKYVPAGNDTAGIALGIKSNGTYMLGNPPTPAQGPIGIALFAAPQWGLGTVVIGNNYLNSNTTDTLELQFFSSIPSPGHVPVKGSNLKIDGIFFGYINLPTALQEVADKLNISVYPNPTSDGITISTDAPVEGFRAVISDMNGKLISTYSLDGQNTQINVAEFPSGSYVYFVADKQGNILKRDRFNVVK